MRPCLTPLLISLVIILSYSHTSYAQVYIWGGPGDVNSEFAYGLNDWTTSGYDTTMWVSDEDAIIEELHCFGYRGGLLPNATSFNGAALFFSAKMHSVDGYAYPHSGELSSPIFSTKDHNSVAVHFNQDIRFWNPENVSLLQVSTDGGISWSPEEGIEINPEISGKWNVRCDTAQMLKLIDITEWAANQDTVQIRFVWDGSYYYWLIDDVYVIEKSEVELSIISTLYDPIAAQVPRDQTDARPSKFGLDVYHSGTKEFEKGVVGVNITDNEGNLLYQDSISDVNFLASEIKSIQFENLFNPTHETYTNSGYHYFNYWVKSPGINELNNFDNQSRESYYLTEGRYDCSYKVGSSFTYEEGSYGAFSIFHTGKGFGGIPFITDSVRLQITDDNGQDDFVADVEIFLYEISENVTSGFSNFDTMALAQFNLNDEAHPQLKMVAFGFETSYQGEDYEDFSVGLYDTEFNEFAILEPDTRYLLMAFWNNEEQIYHGVDDKKFYNSTPSCGWYYRDVEGNNSHWDFSPWFGWRLSLERYIHIDTTNVVELSPKTLNVYPIPADDILFIETNDDENIQVEFIQIYDISNICIFSKKIDRLQKQEIINVRDLPPGNYILRLVTNKGVIEKKVVIQH